MKKLTVLAALAASVLAAPVAAQEAMTDRAVLENDVRVLADDAMEGREAGTDGYDRAAQYVAGRYAEIGLTPGGDDGGWYQSFGLVRTSLARDTSMAIVNAEGRSVKMSYGTDFVGGGLPSAGSGAFEAELVFVGYGLDRPDLGFDDLGTVDLEGKVALWVFDNPEGLDPLEERILQQRANERFAAHGAIGAIMLWTPALDMRIPFERGSNFFASTGGLTWMGPDGVPGDTANGLRVSMVASSDMARTLLEGQQLTLDDVAAAQSEGMTPLPAFETGRRVRISYANSVEPVLETSNVIGMLPGTDPALADQYVVITAHLDHEGISPYPLPGGDRIYNGAMDNATGVSAMMEMARLLRANPPRRPILFVALGAEELGLLGSSYHAAFPGLEEGAVLAANVNVDMPVLTWPFTDVVAFGSDRSNLGPYVASAVSEYGLELVPDPNPGEAFFFRSDQYSYVERGIPAVYVELGFGNGGEEAQTSFLSTHYHQPSDEPDRIVYEQLGRFADIAYLVARNVANMDERPGWLPDEYFGRAFGGPIAGEE
ncbi:M28 family peptidase [Aurantiacibacter sp. D1-12]|uniref:M28 family peptidase n=1 Tax=Aurantiacibacter sp. D1-12 TaxID=2993658 RepID=UPI00237C694B|nr:M28 family peptidase [Aurantiacibacter sp. D1-12]MDE1466280.1 M28 family peptidase [Aurantiacibacter sp. D1-12]